MKQLTVTLFLLLITPALLAESKGNNFYTEIDALYLLSPGDFNSEQTMGFTFGYEFNSSHAI